MTKTEPRFSFKNLIESFLSSVYWPSLLEASWEVLIGYWNSNSTCQPRTPSVWLQERMSSNMQCSSERISPLKSLGQTPEFLFILSGIITGQQHSFLMVPLWTDLTSSPFHPSGRHLSQLHKEWDLVYAPRLFLSCSISANLGCFFNNRFFFFGL